MAQIEFSMLSQACLRGRNADEDNLEEAVNDCVSERNTAEAAIGWRSPARMPDANSTASARANRGLTLY